MFIDILFEVLLDSEKKNYGETKCDWPQRDNLSFVNITAYPKWT